MTWRALGILLALPTLTACDRVLDIPDRFAAANMTCSDGTCACDLGWTDCNSDLQRDGCEVRTDDDPANCGLCGQDCMGGECVAGGCQPVVATPEGFDVQHLTLAASDSVAFFGTPAGISQVTLTPGGAPTVELIVPLEDAPRALVAWDGGPIWADQDGIHRLSGTLLATTGDRTVTVMQLADGVLHYGVEEPMPPHTIGRLSVDDPADATELAQVPEVPQAVAGDSDGLYWLATLPTAAGPSRTGIYDLNGGPHDTMPGFASETVALDIALSPDEVLYARSTLGGFDVARSERNTFSPSIDDRLPTARSFTLFNDRITFSDRNGGVSSVPLATNVTETTLLAAAQTTPTQVTVNDEATFWLTTELADEGFRIRVVYIASQPHAD